MLRPTYQYSVYVYYFLSYIKHALIAGIGALGGWSPGLDLLLVDVREAGGSFSLGIWVIQEDHALSQAAAVVELILHVLLHLLIGLQLVGRPLSLSGHRTLLELPVLEL